MKEMYNKVKDKTNANYYVLKIQKKNAKKRKWAKIGFPVFLLALHF